MGEEQCTPHSVRAKVLDEIVLEEIRKVTYYARAQTREFVCFINQKKLCGKPQRAECNND